jgi:hypothetical protein
MLRKKCTELVVQYISLVTPFIFQNLCSDKDFSSFSGTGFQNSEASNLHEDGCSGTGIGTA